MIPNDSKDYYPTPPALAAELLAGLKIDGHSIEYAGGPILEPSAGSGDLARAAGLPHPLRAQRRDDTVLQSRARPCRPRQLRPHHGSSRALQRRRGRSRPPV